MGYEVYQHYAPEVRKQLIPEISSEILRSEKTPD
jgi:hypothetical protein